MLYWHNYWIICWIVILNVEFTLGLVIEYVGIISINWVNWLWLLLICAGLWIWVVSSIGEVLSNFFLTFEFNYIIICIELCRCVKWKPELVAHVWSQLVRLAARRGTYTTYAVNRCCLFQRYFTAQRQHAFAAKLIYLQVRGTMEGRPFNVSLLRFYFFYKKNYNIIYEVIIIEFI